MSFAAVKNIGAFLKSLVVGAGTLTAGGAGDAQEVTGQTIDRLGYNSAVVAVPFKATLAEDATLKLTVKRQESADGSSWDAATTLENATVVATGEAGGSTEYGVLEIDEDLSGLKRYVRYNVTPDLSAGATDTAQWGAVAVLGGAVEKPAA